MRYKYNYRLLLLSAALALITPSVSAQQLRATRSHFSTEDGLCSNAVSMISQDDLGFIWIATWNGLSRYDGYHFYNYKTGNSSNIKNLHNRILDIVIDQSQNVWMHMYDGRVFVLNRHTDQIINPFKGFDGYEEYRTNSPLLVTSQGEVFVSIEGHGLFILSLDRRGLKSELMNTGGLTITSMAEGYQSDIWLGTNEGIHRLDRSNLTLEKKGILLDEHISCLHSNGYNIYASTANGGIYSFAYGQEPELLRKPNGMGIFSIYVDSHRLIWFCDDRMGVSRINPENGNEKFFEQTVLVPEQDGRGGEFNEYNGIVWIRMNHGGYGYYNREKDVVEYFHNDPSNPWNLSNTVNAAFVLPEGVVWESTSRRGLEKLEILKNNIVRVRPVPNAVSTVENEIRAMYYDKENKLMLLGNKSSCIFLIYDDGRQATITHDSQGNSFGRLYGISKDSKGNYWLCSKDYGLFKMTSDGNGGWNIKNYRHEEGNKNSLSDNNTYRAVEDKYGNIWVATYGGGVNMLTTDGQGETIFLHSKNGMKDYPKKDFMKVRDIEADNDGTVWAGTTDGILLLSYKDRQMKTKRLNTSDEGVQMLMSNDIVCVKRDAKGRIWIGTNGGGLAYTEGKDANGLYPFNNFGSEDGLPSEEIRSITFDNHGNAWFATEHIICSFDIETLNGYYIVDRNKLMTEKGSLLKLHITDFYVDGEVQSPRLNSHYDYYVPMSRHVELPASYSSFAFRFAAMNYQLQHRVHYQYMLEGYDKEWQNADKDLTARYEDVPAGTYTFKVKAFLLESPDKYDQATIEVKVPLVSYASLSRLWIYAVILLAVVAALILYWRRKVKK